MSRSFTSMPGSTLHIDTVSAVISLSVVFLFGFIVRRLFFHPLRHFPGPKWAAVTSSYKAYYALAGGKMLQNVERLHERYGPVVRVAPDELSFNDPRAYFDIYSIGSKFTKAASFYKMFGQYESSFGFIDPHNAKIRREILSPLFSRRAIIKLEDVIQQKVDKLVSQLASHCGKTQPVNIAFAFRSATLDIIASYCFNQCFDTLDEIHDFGHPLISTSQAMQSSFWIFRYIPFMPIARQEAPEWLIACLPSSFRAMARLRKQFAAEIDSLLADPGKLESAEHETVYHYLLNPHLRKTHYQIPSRSSLVDEAMTLLMAGSDTVGHASSVTTFYVFNDRDVRARLVEELQRAWPDPTLPFGYENLEKLPYLTAVIKEGLRFSHGVVTPLARVIGPADAQIAGYHIPAGTTVSMGPTFMHHNQDVFPDPFKFSPERWLHPNSGELDNYLVPFSRGPRMCLGINLAWCELYVILGNIFRKLNLEVFDTTADDFLKFRDVFVPISEGRRFHVLVKDTVA